jgi:DNA-binding transcriptional MerR regulator
MCAMERAYSVSTLAQAAGVPPSTVRFYERRGLLQPEARTRSDYRQYGEPALERLRFIRAAQASGFTLEDVSALLRLRDGGSALSTCKSEIRPLLSARLADVEGKIRELESVRTALSQAIRVCDSSTGTCALIEKLTISARPKSDS